MRVVSACFVVAALAGACGGKRDATPGPGKDAGPPVVVPDARMDVAQRPLGLPDLAAWRWPDRAGHIHVMTARGAESVGDWSEVAAACERALGQDPSHLEANWLLAIAKAKLGKLDEVLAPLQIAAAGDFSKWGLGSLERPAFQPFLASPIGEAWRRRIDEDRATYVEAIGRSLVVRAAGDLYAWDPTSTRWFRLTRTSGRVLAALRSPGALWYVVRGGVGVVDLTAGKTYRPLDVGGGDLELAAAWVKTGAHVLRHTKERAEPLAKKERKRPAGSWLAITAGIPVLHTKPLDGIAADWDERGFASAVRITRTNRVLTAPGQIDGASLAWSSDRTRLAFVAELADDCAPGETAIGAFVADAATGTITKLGAAAHGIAIEWVDDARVAIASDDGVTLVALDGSAQPLVGATDLVTPRRLPSCAETPVADPTPAPDPERSEPPEAE